MKTKDANEGITHSWQNANQSGAIGEGRSTTEDAGTRGRGDTWDAGTGRRGTGRRGDGETRDGETRNRRWDAAQMKSKAPEHTALVKARIPPHRLSPSRLVSPSPRLRVSVSPCPRVSVSPCLRVSVSPCPRVSVSPCLRVYPSRCRRVSPSPVSRLRVSVSRVPRLPLSASPRHLVSLALLLVFTLLALSGNGFAQGRRSARKGSHPSALPESMSPEARELVERAIDVICTERRNDPKGSHPIDEMQARPSLPVYSAEAVAGAQRAQRLLRIARNLVAASINQLTTDYKLRQTKSSRLKLQRAIGRVQIVRRVKADMASRDNASVFPEAATDNHFRHDISGRSSVRRSDDQCARSRAGPHRGRRWGQSEVIVPCDRQSGVRPHRNKNPPTESRRVDLRSGGGNGCPLIHLRNAGLQPSSQADITRRAAQLC